MLLRCCWLFGALARLAVALLPSAQLLSLSPGAGGGADELVRTSDRCPDPATWSTEGFTNTPCAIIFHRKHCGAVLKAERTWSKLQASGTPFYCAAGGAGPLEGWGKLAADLGSAIVFSGSTLEIGSLTTASSLSSVAFQGPLIIHSFARRQADTLSVRCFCGPGSDGSPRQAKEERQEAGLGDEPSKAGVLPDPFRSDEVAPPNHPSCYTAERLMEITAFNCAFLFQQTNCEGKVESIVPAGSVLEVVSGGLRTPARAKLFSGVSLARLAVRANLRLRCYPLSQAGGALTTPLEHGRSRTWLQLGPGPAVHATDRAAEARALRALPMPLSKPRPTSSRSEGDESEAEEVHPDPFRGDVVATADHPDCVLTEDRLRRWPNACAFLFEEAGCTSEAHVLSVVAAGRLTGLKSLSKSGMEDVASVMVPEGQVLELVSGGRTSPARAKLFSGVSMARLGVRANLRFRCYPLPEGGGALELPFAQGRSRTWLQLGTGPAFHATDRVAEARALRALPRHKPQDTPKHKPSRGGEESDEATPRWLEKLVGKTNRSPPWRDKMAGADHPRCRVTKVMRAKHPSACAYFFPEAGCRGEPFPVEPWTYAKAEDSAPVPGLLDLDDAGFEGELQSLIVPKGRVLELLDRPGVMVLSGLAASHLADREDLRFRCYVADGFRETFRGVAQLFNDFDAWIQTEESVLMYWPFIEALMSRDDSSSLLAKSGMLSRSRPSWGGGEDEADEDEGEGYGDQDSVADPWADDEVAPMDHPPCARARRYFRQNPDICAVFFDRPHCGGEGHAASTPAYKPPFESRTGKTAVPNSAEMKQSYGSLVVSSRCFLDLIDEELDKTKVLYNSTLARLGRRGRWGGRVLRRSYPLRDARGRPHLHIDWDHIADTWLQMGEESLVKAGGDLSALPRIFGEEVVVEVRGEEPRVLRPANHTAAFQPFDGVGQFRHKTRSR